MRLEFRLIPFDEFSGTVYCAASLAFFASQCGIPVTTDNSEDVIIARCDIGDKDAYDLLAYIKNNFLSTSIRQY